MLCFALFSGFTRCVYWRPSALHYTDVTMIMMASQITSPTVVYWTVYSDADQRKHQSSASLAFVWGIHRDRWIPRTEGQLRGKCSHLMTSSWLTKFPKFYANELTLNYLYMYEILHQCFSIRMTLKNRKPMKKRGIQVHSLPNIFML